MLFKICTLAVNAMSNYGLILLHLLLFLENLKPLLPSNFQNKLHLLTSCRKFDLSYDLNCHSLCSDFQEDITFRFSLGWAALVNRFLGPKNAHMLRLGMAEPNLAVSALVVFSRAVGPADH